MSSLHIELLHQARHLAMQERRKPKQASLRRAISAAYYALFHLLIHESTLLMIRGKQRTQLRLRVQRAFGHKEMKEVAVSFAQNSFTRKIGSVLIGMELPTELRNFAGTFVDMQQARHEADYDISVIFTRKEVLDLIVQSERAFEQWKLVKGTIQADTFLIALLVQRMIKS